MKKLIFGLVIAFTLLTFTQMVAQEASLPNFQTNALLIGVSDYEHHIDLVNPVIDVKAIEEELREVYKCKTKMLLNPTKRQFLGELHQQAKRKYGQNDQLLVLFSGHGWFDETIKRGYLALKDSKPLKDDPIYESYVSHEDVRAVLERLDCKHVLLIVDSCFSGTLDPTIAMANKGRAAEDIYASVPRAKYIERKLKYKTRRYITAGGKEFVSDGRPRQHSPFARRILESLRTFGGRDEILTLEEMMLEIEKAMPEPRMGELFGNEPGSSFVLMASPFEPPKPEPKHGELIVITIPKNAKVTIKPLDNPQRGIGVKPRGNRYRLLVGKYRVSASLRGYETKTQDVYVGEGEKTIRLKLPPEVKYGELTIITTPSNAQVTVESLDNQQRGIGVKPRGNRYRLPLGKYRVSASLTGHKTTTQDVDVREGQRTVRLNLPEETVGEITGKDGAPMVLIPAGEFKMGSQKNVHTVYLNAFYMDKYEVTNARFKKFLEANPQWQKDRIDRKYADKKYYLADWNGVNYPEGKAGHPVIYVSWYAAAAYAQWAGKRLPTEAQWEKAARGGLTGKQFPWGDELRHDYANYSGIGGRDQWNGTSPVGSFPANGYELFDMAGNVCEWCADAYDSDYYKSSPKDNPTGPGTAILFVSDDFTNVKNSRVLRGGSWNHCGHLLCVYRSGNDPSSTVFGFGVRCCRSR